MTSSYDILAWARVAELKEQTLERTTSPAAWLHPGAPLGRALTELVTQEQFVPPLSVSAINDGPDERAFSFSWSPGGEPTVGRASAVPIRLPLHLLVHDSGRCCKYRRFTIAAPGT